MNREQMIAWLTLEGWSPCTDISKHPGLRSGDRRVWVNSLMKYYSSSFQAVDSDYQDSENPVEWDYLEDEPLSVLVKNLMMEHECK